MKKKPTNTMNFVVNDSSDHRIRNVNRRPTTRSQRRAMQRQINKLTQ